MRTGSVRAQRGFTYMLLLMVLAIIAAASAATLSLGSRMERAEAQRDLVWRERQYAHAIASYAAATPGVAHGPRTVAELELDTRRPGAARHLRRAYVDPVTMADDWRIFRDPGGWIIAICSPLVELNPPSDGAQREQDDPCLPYVANPGAYEANARQFLSERSAGWAPMLRTLENSSMMGVTPTSVAFRFASRRPALLRPTPALLLANVHAVLSAPIENGFANALAW